MRMSQKIFVNRRQRNLRKTTKSPTRILNHSITSIKMATTARAQILSQPTASLGSKYFGPYLSTVRLSIMQHYLHL